MDNVTQRAQRLFVLARREADRFAQKSVGSEHLLLGLLALEEGVGFVTLKNLGADIGKIRKTVEDELQYGQQFRVEPKIPARDEFMSTLHRAGVEAEVLKKNYLGTEHILIALFSVEDGITHRALRSVPVDPSVVREMVVKTLATSENQKKDLAHQRPDGTSAKAPPSNPSHGGAVPHP